MSFDEDDLEEEYFDSLTEDLFLPCEAAVPDLDEDVLLEGVTFLDGFDPKSFDSTVLLLVDDWFEYLEFAGL